MAGVHFGGSDLPSSTVRRLFNASGVATHTYSYGLFGEAQGASGSSGQPLRFAARELEAMAAGRGRRKAGAID